MTKTENTTTDTRAVLGVFGVRAAGSLRPRGYRSAQKSQMSGVAVPGAAVPGAADLGTPAVLGAGSFGVGVR